MADLNAGYEGVKMTELELIEKLNALRQITGEGHSHILIAAVLICDRLDKLTKAVWATVLEGD